MTLAASLFLITPSLEYLDVAFQGLNTWHSFLYKADGMIGSATVARFAARGWDLYAVGIGLTAACGVLYLALRGLVLLIDAGRATCCSSPTPLPPHRRRDHLVPCGPAARHGPASQPVVAVAIPQGDKPYSGAAPSQYGDSSRIGLVSLAQHWKSKN